MPKLIRFCVAVVCGVCLLGLLAISANAQTQVLGQLGGTITDASGSAIPGAQVTVTNKGTGQTSTATSDDSGYYKVVNLQAGDYDVTAEKAGFQRCANTGVHLDPAGSVQLTCKMQVGQVTQTVEVSAASLTVQTEESKVSRVINDTQIEEMPANGRNFATLLALQPGVVQAFSFNSFQGMNLFATQDTHVNGMRGDANNVQIEGSPSTRTRANGAMVAAPSIDAIGEINIVTTGYMPEYSRGAGGQIIVQMKSGTQTYHGGAYEFLRNDKLDARNFFATERSKLKFNNFGYDFGGPVIPHNNKLFFYWSQEWGKTRSTGPTRTSVPTTLVRTGDFSEYCAANLGCPLVPTYLGGHLEPGGVVLLAGQPFPGNKIPQDVWSPNGSAFVQMMAQPTNGLVQNNFVQEIGSPQNDRKETIKADYQFQAMKASHLAVALRHYTQDALPSWGTSGSSQLLQIHPLFPERGATIDFSTNFSPTLLNDFTATATEDIVHVNLDIGKGLNRGSLGVNYPYIFGLQSKDVDKIPTVNINNVDGISGLPYPSSSVGKVFTFQDVLTQVSGNHTLKYGVWIEQDGENDRDQVRVTPGSAGGIGNNLNGTFTFDKSNTATTTGVSMADAFLGNYGVYSELGFRNYTPWVAMQEGLFAQDSWKMSPNFTIQGGLRWDYFPPYHSRWCNFSSFDPLLYSRQPGTQQVIDTTPGSSTFGDVIGGNPYNGIAVPCSQLPNDAVGHFAVFKQLLTSSNLSQINAQLKSTGVQPGLSDTIFATHKNLFQPRLGFAWDPFGHGTTSIRAGGGIFYNHFTLSDVTLMGGNTPFQFAAESLNGLADCPGATPTQSAPGQPFTCPAGGGTSTLALPIPMTGGDLLSKIPGIYQWNLTVQHMLPQQTLVEVGYVGTRGRHLVLNSDLNQLTVGTLRNPLNVGKPDSALVPYPGLGGLTVGLNDANSRYDALQLSVQRRLNKGFAYGIAYTFSRTMDYGSDLYANAVNTYDIHYNFGPADWGRKHVLLVNYVYDLPFLRTSDNPVAKAFGGWELSGVAAFESGTPQTITNANGDEAGVISDFGQYATLKSNCNPNNAPHTLNNWFDGTCFIETPSGQFGNSGRGSVWGPGTINWDFGLFKNGPITERLHYQLRGEFYNVLNHPSWNSVDTSLGDCPGISSTGVCQGGGAFGQVNGASDPRVIQLGLKLTF